MDCNPLWVTVPASRRPGTRTSLANPSHNCMAQAPVPSRARERAFPIRFATAAKRPRSVGSVRRSDPHNSVSRKSGYDISVMQFSPMHPRANSSIAHEIHDLPTTCDANRGFGMRTALSLIHSRFDARHEANTYLSRRPRPSHLFGGRVMIRVAGFFSPDRTGPRQAEVAR
jgi:hypothetical protein